MELNLPFGPWKTLASAKWNDHPLSIYINPEKVMLLVVFDKQSTENNGVLLLLRKPFKVEGNTAEMIKNQKKDLTVIEKIVDGQNITYALIDATPKYIPYSQAELLKTIKEQHLELESTSKLFAEVAQNYAAKAIELSKCSEAVVESLCGDPFMLFASPGFASNSSGFSGMQATAGILGVSKDGEQVNVNINLTTSYKVVGGDRKARSYALQVICENALLNSVPCIVFDSTNALNGLALPSKDASRYEEFRMVNRPIGFPLKAYALGGGLFVNLKSLPVELFTELLGIKDSEKVLKLVWGSSSLEDLLKALNGVNEGREITKYMIDKVIRVLKVLQKVYPATFAETAYSELKTPWKEGVGRVFFLDLSKTPDEVRQMLVYTLLEGIGEPVGSELNALIVITENGKNLNPQVKEKIGRLTDKNIAYALTGEQILDLKELPEAIATIEFVNGEPFLIQSGERARFKLRPTYSLINEATTPTPAPQTKK